MQKEKAGILAYLATPIMSALVLIIAITGFGIILKMKPAIPFFIILLVINLVFMILYALLPLRFKNIARYINIFLFGTLLFILAQLLAKQNFQIEGFFFYLLAGAMGGVIINYVNGKIIGPLLAGRNWCGWGCWTIMLLDILPYKKSKGWVPGKIRYLKYIHFILSIGFVALLVFGFQYSIHNPNPTPENSGTVRAFYWALTGNILYYLSGIILAVKFKDNRAFCKYLCPVSVFLKFSNKFSLLKIKGNKESCASCNTCTDNCLMNIKIPEYIKAGERVKADECIMCMKCVATCPQAALKASVGFDFSRTNKIKEC